jgi:hypothetical protein
VDFIEAPYIYMHENNTMKPPKSVRKQGEGER